MNVAESLPFPFERRRRQQKAVMGSSSPRLWLPPHSRASWWTTAGQLWLFLLLLLFLGGASAAATAASGCPHPAVPSGATYVNISGGLATDSWRIKYDCDIGEKMCKIQVVIEFFFDVFYLQEVTRIFSHSWAVRFFFTVHKLPTLWNGQVLFLQRSLKNC